MSARDWLQPQQLKLFMTGREWQSQVTHSTDGPLPSLWAQKEAEAHAPRMGATGQQGEVYGSMRAGYTHNQASPPTIVLEDSPNGKDIRTVQSEGHRRVAAAAAIERDTGTPVYLPTNYVDNTAVGKKRNRKSLGLE